jgi:hypothetical protein
VKIDFFESEYRWELERRNQLNDSVNIPFAVVVALGSALGFFLQDLKLTDSTGLSIIILVLVIVSTVALSFTIWNLVWSYHSEEYNLIDDSSGWLAHRAQIIAFYATNALPVGRTIEDELNEDLIDAYAESARINRTINNEKSKDLYVAKSWLAISLALVAVTTLAFSYRAYLADEKIHKVEVVKHNGKEDEHAK